MAGLYSVDAYEDDTGTSLCCRDDMHDEAEVVLTNCFALSDVNM